MKPTAIRLPNHVPIIDAVLAQYPQFVAADLWSDSRKPTVAQARAVAANLMIEEGFDLRDIAAHFNRERTWVYQALRLSHANPRLIAARETLKARTNPIAVRNARPTKNAKLNSSIAMPEITSNRNEDAFAHIIEIITRDWGGDTVAFYKHVSELPKDFASQLQIEAWANHREELTQENADISQKYCDLAASHARLVKALESLVDQQNGAPLLLYKRQWKDAMDESEAALAEAKALTGEGA